MTTLYCKSLSLPRFFLPYADSTFPLCCLKMRGTNVLSFLLPCFSCPFLSLFLYVPNPHLSGSPLFPSEHGHQFLPPSCESFYFTSQDTYRSFLRLVSRRPLLLFSGTSSHILFSFVCFLVLLVQVIQTSPFIGFLFRSLVPFLSVFPPHE